MDIIDILIARAKSFTGETKTLINQAKKAMSDANDVTTRVSAVEDDATAAKELAETAAGQAAAAAEDFDEMKADIAAAAGEVVNDIIDAKLAELDVDGVSSVGVTSADTSAAKVKNVAVTKNNATVNYTVEKNYTSTGTNEDGGMTQKAITNALNAQRTNLENQIHNIQISGGGAGNVSGNISSEDEGSLVAVDENGNITPSSITENDVILTQIIAGTYKNENIAGLEIDYTNRTFSRLQGAIGLTAGNDFNRFNLFGGRKRCIVDASGNITSFLNGEETLESLAGKRIMVYQPAFYYLRVPITTSQTDGGEKLVKEQIYVSDTKFAGFSLHPLFKDAEGKSTRYALLPAFECGTYRTASGTYETGDAQNVDLENDCLVSMVNTKPISGVSQAFTAVAAKRMAENNGTGWHLINLAYQSVNQMLMAIEYGSLNLQSAFNSGITKITSGSTTENIAAITGSTLSLLNASGQASSTTITRGNTSNTYTNSGWCAISYRGVENPYGNIWQFIDGVEIYNRVISYNGTNTTFKAPTSSGWINGFGYHTNIDWVFIPIEVGNGANSNLPIGDYLYVNNTSDKKYTCIVGGYSTSSDNAGPFYYAFDLEEDTFHYCHDSGRVMFIPTANSTTETNNYNAWYNTMA